MACAGSWWAARLASEALIRDIAKHEAELLIDVDFGCILTLAVNALFETSATYSRLQFPLRCQSIDMDEYSDKGDLILIVAALQVKGGGRTPDEFAKDIAEAFSRSDDSLTTATAGVVFVNFFFFFQPDAPVKRVVAQIS